MENRPAYLFHWLALNSLGVSVVPISAEMRSAELEYLIAHSEICLAVSLPGRVADLRTAAQTAGMTTQVVALGQIDFPPPPPGSDAGQAPTPQTECALLYTSGTTARPKGCRLSNEYFLRIGQWYV